MVADPPERQAELAGELIRRGDPPVQHAEQPVAERMGDRSQERLVELARVLRRLRIGLGHGLVRPRRNVRLFVTNCHLAATSSDGNRLRRNDESRTHWLASSRIAVRGDARRRPAWPPRDRFSGTRRTPSVGIPAASPAATPGRRVLDHDAASGGSASRSAASRNMSGAGLPCSTSSPAIVTSNARPGVGQRAVQPLAHRRGGDRDRHAARPQLRHRGRPRRRTPRAARRSARTARRLSSGQQHLGRGQRDALGEERVRARVGRADARPRGRRR